MFGKFISLHHLCTMTNFVFRKTNIKHIDFFEKSFKNVYTHDFYFVRKGSVGILV